MTIDEIRDQIAEWEGCEIPYTLDEAAKLPEGWNWNRYLDIAHGLIWVARRNGLSGPVIAFSDSHNEINDRFRLRHAAMKAERAMQ